MKKKVIHLLHLFVKDVAGDIKECAACRQNSSTCLGRSMIEMLGVLAIIGVLSIGGLYAYRQAMIRHQVNTFMDFMNRLYFARMEVCPSRNECNLSDDPRQNQERMCGLVGLDMCDKFNSSLGYDTVYPYLPSTAWMFQKVSLGESMFRISGIPKAMCQKIVVMDYPYLSRIRIYNRTDYIPSEGAAGGYVMSDENKALLQANCEDKNTIYFGQIIP